METEFGVPTASIHTDAFETEVRATVHQQGMPFQRLVFVPQPVLGKSPEELSAYVEGADAVTGRPVMEEVLEAITKPLTEEETKRVSFDRSTPRLVDAKKEERMHEHFMANGWTDYLPIILPTEERVQEMLVGTSHSPDEVVGKMRPTGTREAWEFTVEKVAVNAVMAGAKPAYFPVILALAASGVTARSSTSSSGASMAMVNGPIREEIGMNWGIGAMGPYNHANATIGRAYGLLSQNLQGGSDPEVTYLGSQGNNYAYNSVTFAENEDRSPWEPFHVQHGFKASDSAVSVFSSCKATTFQLGLRRKHWREHVQNMLRGLNPNVSPILVLDPITARQFVDYGGFDTKEELIDWVHENATMPAGIYWDYQMVENFIEPRALQGEEPYASMHKANDGELIRIFPKKGIQVVVVGGELNGYWRIMGASYAKTVSVDKWR